MDEEVFLMDEIRPTDSITYKIRDLNGEEIEGTFYREELQKTDQTVFRIERDLLYKITLSTSTFYQKYSLLTTIVKIDQ